MAAIGIILKNTIDLTRKLPKRRKDPYSSQLKVLNKLLRKAQFTVFGQEHSFGNILEAKDRVRAFRKQVPIFTYESIYPWWLMSLEGETSVTWPGKVDFFALSSGTSTGSTKYIPVTRAMLKAIQKASIKQILSLAYCDLPKEFYERDILMLGGSTNLDYNGIYFAGDLSGITTGNIPFWFMPFYKPGKEISRTKNWQEKLDLITREAHKWDVGAIAGSPPWFQLLMERIIDHYKLKNIHEIWPNLQVFTHGAVAFEPYRKSFEALLGKPLIYLETYLASEGFIAYQAHPAAGGMRMVVRNGIFFEFVPFNDANVDSEGNIREQAEALTIKEVRKDVDYALVISTCAGAWRYVIGDVIRFTSVKNYEIRIVGRTKHYLSLTGEHLSVENMNRAIELVSNELNIQVKEFTVAGIPYGRFFAHHWFVAVEADADKETLRRRIDHYLCEVNDDYATERQHPLKEMFLDIVPNVLFLGWLKAQGKEGAQIKFPRVLRKEQYASWIKYLKENGLQPAEPNA